MHVQTAFNRMLRLPGAWVPHLGFDRATVARYSFLLSVPAVVLSGLLEFAGILTCANRPRRRARPARSGNARRGTRRLRLDRPAAALPHRPPTRVFVGYRVTLGVGVLELASMGAIA